MLDMDRTFLLFKWLGEADIVRDLIFDLSVLFDMNVENCVPKFRAG
jgi:hypothetical protein